MPSMKAWRFDRYGAPSVLALHEMPMPTPGPGEVLVRIDASGVNPSDVKNVSGHFKAKAPRTPGRDYAGVIVAGEGREGEEVWGSGPGFGVARDGTHATYVAMPSAWVTPKPRRLGMAEAAAVGVPYLAAWASVVTEGRLREGETILVTGISGAVGRAATQIAHKIGARVIGAGRSSDNPSQADAIIDTTTQDLVQETLAKTDGRGVDLVLDGVGGALFEPCLRCLRPGGRQIAIASNPKVVTFDLVDFYHRKSQLLGVDTMGISGEEIASILRALHDGFEDGSLRAPEVQSWPFERAVDAYDATLASKKTVKHVLTMTAA